MFTHVTLGADDLAIARRFYDAALGALGIPPGVEDERGRIIYASQSMRLLLTRPIDGEAASRGNGCTIGFPAASPAAADAWHAAGIANGGTTCEDPPGIRRRATGDVYLAYLRDPTGNKLCVLHRLSP